MMEEKENSDNTGRVNVYRIMPSKFEFLKVAELDLLTDKIECNGIKNN
jgi:hypothetical protein